MAKNLQRIIVKTIGIIGGMSFESTTTYYKIINKEVAKKLGGLNSAKIVLYSLNFEEIAALQERGEWERATEILGEAARKLELAGADFILIATNTMHKIYDGIQNKITIPIIHIAYSTAEVLKEKRIKKVGLLGTQYTMSEDFYTKILNEQGIEVLIPSQNDRQEISDIIFSELCKGQIKIQSKNKYLQIIEKLHAQGAQAIVLGCTEIGLLLKARDAKIPLFDTCIIHSKHAAKIALAI